MLNGRPSSLSELTPIIFYMELTHLGWETSNLYLNFEIANICWNLLENTHVITMAFTRCVSKV